MASLIPNASAQRKKHWLALGVLGLAAVAGGVFLPRGLTAAARPEGAAAPAPSGPAAGNDSPYAPPAFPDVPSGQAMFLRLGLGTVAVLVLCAATLWAGKRWIDPLSKQPLANRQLRILEALPLQGRCAVYLLQAGPCQILAGLDGSGLKVLLPLTEPFDAGLDKEVRHG